MVPQNVLDVAAALGIATAYGRTALPDLALLAAQQTLAGKVKASHAEDIYLAYYTPIDAVMHTMTPGSLRSNTSKLRQIILLVERQKRKGIKVLKEAIKIHTALVLQCRQEKLRRPVYDLYGYMVLCAREALASSRVRDAEMAQRARSRLIKQLGAR